MFAGLLHEPDLPLDVRPLRGEVMMLRRVVLFSVACAVTLSACSKKKPEVVTPDTTPAVTAPDTAAARIAREAAERARQDSIANARAAEEAADRERRIAALRGTLEEAIYFDYDDDKLRDDAAESLGQKVQILRANPGIRIRITGHTDERGSIEYNLALGMRRAQVVKDYLVGFSIDESRMEIVSMGEDQPQDPGHDESAWSRNRRAGFTITSGNTLTAPGQ
jgi:peptidoglycan-associated lipoprotein